MDAAQPLRLPPLTCAQQRAIDRLASEEFGIPGIVLMENAGRGVADTLERLVISGPVVIVCGRGNNAGDGLVVARHLELRGYAVRLVLAAPPEQFAGDALTNWRTIQAAGIHADWVGPQPSAAAIRRLLDGADWLIDALLGTGARGAPRPPMDQVVVEMNRQPARRLAIDLPSGLDADTGEVADPTLRADHTCTFVAPKPALVQPTCAPWVGQLHVLDIGAPRRLLARFLDGEPPPEAENGTV